MKPGTKFIGFFLLLLMPSAPALAAPGLPPGWFASGRPVDYEFGTDTIQGANGKQAAYVKAKPGAQPNQFGGMMQCIRADNYLGQRLRFAARLKSVKAGKLQLWMRVDGPPSPNGSMAPSLAFYNMADRPITGTADWQRTEVVLDVPRNGAAICYGFFLAGGEGEAWADGLSLTKVGQDVPVSVMRSPTGPMNLGFER